MIKMDFEHPKFEEFIVRLEGPGFCDFRHMSDGGTDWDCNGDFTFTKKLLNEYEVDVDSSLEFFVEHGGRCCDCEVCLNVPISTNGSQNDNPHENP